ncbi:hypothetical protein V3C99_011322 [Haemonchus contortus]
MREAHEYSTALIFNEANYQLFLLRSIVHIYQIGKLRALNSSKWRIPMKAFHRCPPRNVPWKLLLRNLLKEYESCEKKARTRTSSRFTRDS